MRCSFVAETWPPILEDRIERALEAELGSDWRSQIEVSGSGSPARFETRRARQPESRSQSQIVGGCATECLRGFEPSDLRAKRLQIGRTV